MPLEDSWRRHEEQRQADEERPRWEPAMERASHDFRLAALAAELAGYRELAGTNQE